MICTADTQVPGNIACKTQAFQYESIIKCMLCYKSVTLLGYILFINNSIQAVSLKPEFTMSADELMVSENKHIVSMRLNNNDRKAIQTLASRLFVRESELYRFAISYLLGRMDNLQDVDCAGSNLLGLFIDFRAGFNEFLNLKKQQVFKIVNNGNADPEKFVAMSDIELLVLPDHLLRQRLTQTEDAQHFKDPDINLWLKNYLLDRYGEPSLF